MKKIFSFVWFGLFAALAVFIAFAIFLKIEQSIVFIVIAFLFGGGVGYYYGYKILDFPADISKWQLVKFGLKSSLLGFLLGVFTVTNLICILNIMTTGQTSTIWDLLSALFFINLFAIAISSLAFGWLAILLGIFACFILFYLKEWIKKYRN